MSTFTVFGNYGSLIVDALTGIVQAYHPDIDADETDNYSDIVHFNIKEWQGYYPDDVLAGAYVDILDIGFTTLDLTYEPPVDDYRQNIADGMQVVGYPSHNNDLF